MVGYKDMTFCTRYYLRQCINHNCHRAFTSKNREDAIYWWKGENFPISLSDCWDEHCGEIVNAKKETKKLDLFYTEAE